MFFFYVGTQLTRECVCMGWDDIRRLRVLFSCAQQRWQDSVRRESRQQPLRYQYLFFFLPDAAVKYPGEINTTFQNLF